MFLVNSIDQKGGIPVPRTALLLVAPLALALTLGGCSSEEGPSAPSPTASGDFGAGTSDGNTSDTLAAAPFAEVVGEPGTIVLDVRAPEEFAAGQLEGARNLDVSAPDFAEQVAQLPADGRYAVYCRSGNRSAQALTVMRDAGIRDAVHLDGGITAWQSSGRPVATE